MEDELSRASASTIAVMSIYDGIDPAVLQARLSETQDAYHALAVGGQTVSVKLGDKAIAYTAANLDKLGAIRLPGNRTGPPPTGLSRRLESSGSF